VRIRRNIISVSNRVFANIILIGTFYGIINAKLLIILIIKAGMTIILVIILLLLLILKLKLNYDQVPNYV